MHNHENIRSILGLSQDELATLLAVTRSQISMYELGKRDLPASAKLKLAELIVNAPNKNLRTFNTNCITKEDEQKIINEFIFLNQREFQNLEMKIIRLNKKIEKIENATFLFENLKINDRVEKSIIENLKPKSEILKLKKEQFKNNIKMKILIENKIILEKLT